MNDEELSSGREFPVSIELAADLIDFRRDLHRHPELSLHESRTAGKVAYELRKLGLQVREGVGGHGVIAELQGDQPGPTIALRADMDALPIQEESGLKFASTVPGVMHACGHDAHTAILLGAAKLLTAITRPAKGTIRFLFQPAEEISIGARAMIEQGALDGVDEIYGLHNLPTLPAGMAATRRGAMMGSVDRLEVAIYGVGGHGAIPDQTVDPIVCASAIVSSLQTIVSREVSPFDPVVVTIGSIHAGEAFNIIPTEARLTGTIRTFDPIVQASMPERVQRIINQIAAGYRCTASVTVVPLGPVLVNDNQCVTYVDDIIKDQIGADRLIEAPPTLAGEDFAFFLREVKGCFFWLGSGSRENADQAYGLHNPRFNLNEACIPLGASLLASIAHDRLQAI